ncbi:unnamed protein product [Rhizophagus irregularis]|nr:unnamed protein product [Rhizophagus irregularis]
MPENIKIKQVIAASTNQPGGSRCTMECDTENHQRAHILYNVQEDIYFMGTTIHDCSLDFTLGKIRPDYESPNTLIN